MTPYSDRYVAASKFYDAAKKTRYTLPERMFDELRLSKTMLLTGDQTEADQALFADEVEAICTAYGVPFEVTPRPFRVYLEWGVGAIGWSAEDVTGRLRNWTDAGQFIVKNLETGETVTGREWLAAVSQETPHDKTTVEIPQSQKRRRQNMRISQAAKDYYEGFAREVEQGAAAVELNDLLQQFEDAGTLTRRQYLDLEAAINYYAGATADHALGVGVQVGRNPELVLFRQG